jgi:2-keto-4-pentenoate hydratase/2-oxohepta-3-ene-1,7-dioic acid hydratase in catechol pathway
MELDLDDVGKFVALGHTFGSHSTAAVDWPVFWIEPREALVPGGETIVLPSEIEDAGIGPELTAVLGAELHRATPAEAAEAIAGFTVSNDVSAAGDWPGHPGEGILSHAYKMFPTFRPVATEVVECDVDRVSDARITASIDGDRVADESTAGMRFSVEAMVAEVSRTLKLHPGDAIALGEPACEGTLGGATEVSCRIEGVGELSNPVEERGDDPVAGLDGE